MNAQKKQVEKWDAGAQKFIDWLWVDTTIIQTKTSFDCAMSNEEIAKWNTFLDELDKAFELIKSTEKLWLFSTSWRIEQISELQSLRDVYFSDTSDLTLSNKSIK